MTTTGLLATPVCVMGTSSDEAWLPLASIVCARRQSAARQRSRHFGGVTTTRGSSPAAVSSPNQPQADAEGVLDLDGPAVPEPGRRVAATQHAVARRTLHA